MARVILLIGRLCSGKTTLAQKLAREEKAVVLSCDELMQTVFPEPLGEMYDVYSGRCMTYLYKQTRYLVESGCSVVLDWGFWTSESRQQAQQQLAGLTLDWYYLAIDDAEWHRRMDERNARIVQGEGLLHEYFVDEGLFDKAAARFEAPQPEEGLTITMIQ